MCERSVIRFGIDPQWRARGRRREIDGVASSNDTHVDDAEGATRARAVGVDDGCV